MAKFCTECGKEIQNGVAFCTECGAKAPVDSAPAANPEAVNVTANTAPEIKTEPKVETKVETPPAVHTSGAQTGAQNPAPPQTHQQTYAAQPQPQTYQAQQGYQAQQTYSPPPQTTYQQPVAAAPAADPTNKVVGTGTYFGLMLLFALPIIGFIACIIMCFAPKNKNLKHFARANLIWAIIALVIGGLIIGGIYMLSNSLMDYINQLTDGQFSGWGDLFGNLGDLEGLTEQFGNGGLEGLPVE